MTSPDLLVAPAVHDRLLDRAREGAPNEVCGVLGGVDPVDGPTRVTTAPAVPNVAATPETRYELAPAEMIEAIERVEASTTHLGFYHSHPRGPPGPSATDEAQATWSGSVYAIVSLPDAGVRAWRWTGETFERLSVGVGP
ncbi:desampylase [Salinigranum salinum]|uniref:desampylase n=1 Tax=Salinigranum salinum TaxID=1364937 RepID=UPI001260CEAD|nr:desampylase [Salinigranum salinum]